jgi:hypothetical protein
MIPFVIECKNGKTAPYSFVCRHLVENPQQNWVSMDVQDGREVENDWLCEDCAGAFEAGSDLVETLVPVCINCVRDLRGEPTDDVGS